MEDSFAVQVLQPAGNIKRQTHPDTPRQVEVAVQQLLQIPSVDVLQTDGETSPASVFSGAMGTFSLSLVVSGTSTHIDGLVSLSKTNGWEDACDWD